MSFQGFRRFPGRYLRKCRPKVLGSFFGLLFDLLNRGDRLADFIADPRTMLSKYRGHPLMAHFARKPPSQELISVVLATRNNEKTIETSIASILSQTHSNLELIIVDDASTDNSFALVEKLASVEPRIRLVRNASRQGTGRSRNIGMSLAKGYYLTFQDGDDYSASERLERQLDAFRQFPEKKLCLCNYVRVDDQKNRLIINDRRVMKCIISMMFPREEILSRVGYFLAENVGEDTDYYERIKIAFGRQSEILVFGTLYEASFSETSSLFSGSRITRSSSTTINYQRSGVEQERWEGMIKRLEEIRNGERDLFVGHHDAAYSKAGDN